MFNLLPLLPLDGGHIAVNLYERVRDWMRARLGKPKMPPVDYTRLLPITYFVILVGGAVSLLTLTADIVNPIRLFEGCRASADVPAEAGGVRWPCSTSTRSWPTSRTACITSRPGPRAGTRSSSPPTATRCSSEGATRLREALAEHDVVYLTGRPERNRVLTQQRGWPRHGLATEPLHMRPDDDYRPARWVKRQVLRRLAAHPRRRLGGRRRPGRRRRAGGRRLAGGAGHLAAALVDAAERPGAAGPDVTEAARQH